MVHIYLNESVHDLRTNRVIVFRGFDTLTPFVYPIDILAIVGILMISISM